VVAATGLAAGAPWLLHVLELNPLYSLPAAGLTTSGVAQLIGEQAIHLYAQAQIDLQSSSMGLGDRPRDGKTQSGAGNVALARTAPVERLPETRHGGLVEHRAGVGDARDDLVAVSM